ncbi:hypothetical protein D0T50_04300 [Bacteroides sp. 214]|uniref:hypothetical protein n=1 Tax=Bacteroides sp. 214 TaxID=2302935 RepID=UPI0013D7378C|nr:hypothetical protein [Bacteroides sp. 214]NDW12110.1 hypothetical protein [Bacteroides sp. 214]
MKTKVLFLFIALFAMNASATSLREIILLAKPTIRPRAVEMPQEATVDKAVSSVDYVTIQI